MWCDKKMKYLTLIFITFNVYASFFPENYQLEDNAKKSSIVELNALEILGKEVLQRFEAAANTNGGNLKLLFDLSSNTINATAYKQDSTWFIKFQGGLLRHPNLTRSVFVTILCHEIGHHLGGAPYKYGDSGISAEGQADYFAANTCLKDVFKNTSLLKLSISKAPTIIKEKCENQFGEEKNYITCIQSSLTGQEVSQFLSKIGNTRRGRRNPVPNINKRSKTVVSVTNISHPDHQCRLDTYFEGSLCHKGLDEYEPNCLDPGLYNGSRPSCWFYSGK